jgi:hypothetical protein
MQWLTGASGGIDKESIKETPEYQHGMEVKGMGGWGGGLLIERSMQVGIRDNDRHEWGCWGLNKVRSVVKDSWIVATSYIFSVIWWVEIHIWFKK